jgi:hypothetical protein
MMPVEAVTLRTRLFSLSAMYTLSDESTATPKGKFNPADLAWPPSPLNSLLPVPATVVITLVDTVTLRIRLSPASAMYTLPDASSEIPVIKLKAPAVAWPPSPSVPNASPDPAIVVMMPVETVTLRIKQLSESAMYTLPARER